MNHIATPASTDQRYQQMQQWLSMHLPNPVYTLTPVAGDASFRRYFRLQQGEQSYIVMDAPPALEDSQPFVALAALFAAHKVRVPSVLQQDLTQGFLLLSDFGDAVLLSLLKQGGAEQLYPAALDTLLQIQSVPPGQAYPFAHCDAAHLLAELHAFQEWYLEKYLQLDLLPHEQALLSEVFERLVKVATEQPQVCVHRDYHSRNLMWLPQQQVGVLDFQDAMWGPVTYDVVSLLRDCYIAWPDEQVQHWLAYYLQQAQAQQHLLTVSPSQLRYWFDLMGVQRHLKAIYRFSLKHVQEQRSEYLADIPQALRYVRAVSQAHPELAAFAEFLQQRVPQD
jgi:aminoglycoside/choline kinase family phosphotransferase